MKCEERGGERLEEEGSPQVWREQVSPPQYPGEEIRSQKECL